MLLLVDRGTTYHLGVDMDPLLSLLGTGTTSELSVDVFLRMDERVDARLIGILVPPVGQRIEVSR